jgi:hypothetical protein
MASSGRSWAFSNQRQGAGLVLGLDDHGLPHLAHVQPGQPGRAVDDLPQAAGTDGRQSPGLSPLVAHLCQTWQVLREAVEEVRAHGGDEKQGAVGVGERCREQAAEALALVRVGEGEQLFELVHGEQEGRVVLRATAQPVGQGALVVGLHALAHIGHLHLDAALGIAEGAGQLLGQVRDRVLSGHHRADAAPMREPGAGPQPALVHQGQQAGVHQGGLARAAVAVDLQPAHRGAAGSYVEAGQGIQGLLLAAEEEAGLVDLEGFEADEGAAIEERLLAGDGAPVADLLEQPLRKGIAAVPGRGLEQAQEGGERLRGRVPEQDGEDRQALGVVVGAKVADECALGLGPDPASYPVAPHEHHEPRAGIHRLLQASEPELPLANALIVLEDA